MDPASCFREGRKKFYTSDSFKHIEISNLIRACLMKNFCSEMLFHVSPRSNVSFHIFEKREQKKLLSISTFPSSMAFFV